MCGICGQFNFGTRRPADRQLVSRMATSMAHRGPDDEGYFMSGPLGFGFRRLSIIDLSAGHQPMSDPSGQIWLVFNGEIYNFPELRAELEKHNYVFRTNSDTEVIIHGYRHWAIDVLDHLNGMFGLAIWDEQAKRLMLARDRMGIKPVYYRIDDGQVLFGSEIRSLIAAVGAKPEIDSDVVRLFLKYRYTPSPRTIYKGIRKLAPGTRMVVELGSTPRIERWWDFKPTPFERMPSDSDAAEEL